MYSPSIVHALDTLTRRLDAVQQSLDNLLPRQRETEERLDQLTDLQQAFRERLRGFYSDYTQLFATAGALAHTTNDPEEMLEPDFVATDEGTRQVIQAYTVVGIPELIGELIGQGMAEDRLRESEVRQVREMLMKMQDMQSFLTQNGYDASALSWPISSAQTFITNPDRTIDARQMLRGMRDALNALLRRDESIAAEVRTTQAEMDRITRQTQALFAEQRDISAQINHAHDRATAAQTACVGNPFGQITAVPSWDSTFWDISSP